MFVEVEEFPHLGRVQDAFEDVLAEARQLVRSDYLPWVQPEALKGQWLVYPIQVADTGWIYAEVCTENARRCPRTAALLASIEGLTLGGFSMLSAGAHVYPHVDLAQPTTVRSHLPLLIPGETGMRCEDEVRLARPGHVIAFRGVEPHESFNFADEDRVVLLTDVDVGVART